MLNNELNAKGCQPDRCVFPEQETGLLLLSPQGRLEGQVRPIRYLFQRFFILLHSKRNAEEPPHYKKKDKRENNFSVEYSPVITVL